MQAQRVTAPAVLHHPGWRRCSCSEARRHPAASAHLHTHCRSHRPVLRQHHQRQQRQHAGCATAALPFGAGAEASAAAAGAAAVGSSMGDTASSSSSQLLLTCLLMFAAAAGSGLLPSALARNQQLSSSLTTAGAGMLLGSALCIILPEGFQAAQAADGLPEWAAALALLTGFWVMLALDAVSHGLSGGSGGSGGQQQHAKPCRHDSDAGVEAERLLAGGWPCAAHPTAPQQQQQQELAGVASLRGSTPQPRSGGGGGGAANAPSSSPDSHHVVLHTQAGHSRDAAPSAAPSSAQRKTQTGASSAGLAQHAPAGAATAGGSNDVASGHGLAARWRHWLRDPTAQTLLGLLVHAVSDGLAVGAASLSEVPSISLGVATAMVVHKGPVAVGLAVYLRAAGWNATHVNRGILMFAAASPLAALATYGLLARLPSVTDNIPLAVLFSGGTVLYAATMHILPSATHGSSHGSRGPAGGQQQQQQQQHQPLDQRRQLLLLTAGMLAPLLLATAFHHDHGGSHGSHHHHHHD